MDRRKPGIAWTEANRKAYPQLIEEFRFYTPHITKFFDGYGELIKEYPPVPIFKIPVAEIQPSQFFIDEDKIAAIRSFIHCSQDIIIQVMRHNGRYISLDGHTRLYYAAFAMLILGNRFMSSTASGPCGGIPSSVPDSCPAVTHSAPFVCPLRRLPAKALGALFHTASGNPVRHPYSC